ncbi:hypothetical protein HDU96_001830 [Phlyctochytrium bullatum]|nr:hypothetical protein HDU96_001830 [Phlyctochytrium bullatum]
MSQLMALAGVLARNSTVSAIGAAAIALYAWYAYKNSTDPLRSIPSLPLFTLFSPPRKQSIQAKKMGNVFRIFLGPLKYLGVSGGEFVKWVMVKGEFKYMANGVPNRWRILLGPRSVNVLGDQKEHAVVRSLLNKGLNKTVISYFYPNLRSNARVVLAGLCKSSENGTVEIQPYDITRLFTYNVICGFTCSADPRHEQALKDLREEFITWTKGMGDLYTPEWLPFGLSPYGNALKARKKIENVLKEIIAERKERMDKGEVFNDSLGHMMEGLDAEANINEIIDNFINLTFAGYDSTAATLSTCLHVLLNDISPESLAMLRDELTSLPENVEENTLSNLPVLDAFVKETLRLYHPAPGAFRETTQDVTIKEGLPVIPKGTKVLVGFLNTFYDEELFPNPEEFRLERFMVDHVDKKIPMDYSIWGAGPRMCPGQHLAKLEMKVFLLELIRGFEIIKGITPSKRIPFPFNVAVPSLFIKPKAE